MLAEGQVAEAHVLEELQGVVDGGVGGEVIHRLVHGHAQHRADAPALELDLQGLVVEARAAADLAGHLDVGQEAHLDALVALALAGLPAVSSEIIKPYVGFGARRMIVEGLNANAATFGWLAALALRTLMRLMQAGSALSQKLEPSTTQEAAA